MKDSQAISNSPVNVDSDICGAEMISPGLDCCNVPNRTITICYVPIYVNDEVILCPVRVAGMAALFGNQHEARPGLQVGYINIVGPLQHSTGMRTLVRMYRAVPFHTNRRNTQSSALFQMAMFGGRRSKYWINLLDGVVPINTMYCQVFCSSMIAAGNLNSIWRVPIRFWQDPLNLSLYL